MEIVAIVVGVADVTARASSKIWHLCEVWKDAPEEVCQLRDELDRAGRFFASLQNAIQQSFPASVPPSTSADLKSLLNKGRCTIITMQVFLDELCSTKEALGQCTQVGELGKSRRLLWMRRKKKIKKSWATLRHTIEHIGLYLSLLNM